MSYQSDPAIGALLAVEPGPALEQLVAEVAPETVARAVARAPGLDRKTELLWALDDRPRRAVLAQLPPALLGVLIQNCEEENRYLLGDLSFEQFRALLALCSPERRFYWIRTALSFTDVRANALPLLLSSTELAEILDTRSEFEAHCRALAEYPLEEQRIPPELLRDPIQTIVDFLGPERLLGHFPVADLELEQVLQTILDFDPDRYTDLVRSVLHAADYRENHPGEWEALTEEPVLLDEIPPPPVLSEDLGAPAPGWEEGEARLVVLAPVSGSPILRAAEALPPAALQRVEAELQELCARQAVAEGGSFLLADLARIAERMQATLLLGLEAESGEQPERVPAVLFHRPLHRVLDSGGRVLERFRQVAWRLQPVESWLTVEQRSLIRSLIPPRPTLNERD
ncbi:MAG: hypothetical protein FJX77_10605, partial [Armatimonadetes bacterium]|nr:hypothetical protein [Armatimonadota bacterium]